MKYWPLALLLVVLVACGPSPETGASDVADEILNSPTGQVVQDTPKTQDTAAAPDDADEPARPAAEEPEAAPSQTKTSDDSSDEATQDAFEPPEVPDVSGDDAPTKPASGQRTKLYDFLDTFRERVNSYQFVYGSDEYFVRGDRYKIILDQPVTVSRVSFDDVDKNLFYYDTVYVDRSTKRAIAYCEGHDDQTNHQCASLELYDLTYPVAFSEYDLVLPEDWLFTYLNHEPSTVEIGKYYVKGRATTTMVFDLNPTLHLHFDRSTGLPVRADKLNGKQLLERYDYERLASNKVSDADVRHRSRDEIPSEETFFK